MTEHVDFPTPPFGEAMTMTGIGRSSVLTHRIYISNRQYFLYPIYFTNRK